MGLTLKPVTNVAALILVLLATLAWSPASQAVQPDEVLDDPQLEARARKISLELRCLVCQNQSIDDSDAPLARDLRILVRERLEKGESNDEVLSFIVDRYGEFVLLRPPFGWHTLFLWVAPLIVLLGAVLLARSVLTRGRPLASQEVSTGGGAGSLTPDEEEKLRRILDERG